MLLSLKDNQTTVLLGAARAVATGGGTAPLSSDAAGAIVSLAQLGLGAFEVPPLDEAHAASSNGAVAGVDYNPIASMPARGRADAQSATVIGDGLTPRKRATA